MICRTEEQFKRVIYNYSPGGLLTHSLWDSLLIYIDEANRWIKNTFLGNSLYAKYEEFSEEVKGLCDVVVGCKAFYEAIPSLDLVLTSHGFGIVQTPQVAPASPVRVNRLRDQIQRTLFNTMDELLIFFLNEEELRVLFAQGAPFEKLTDSLFLTGSELQLYAGMEGATRKELYTQKALIAEGELMIQRWISVVYFNELLQKVRDNKVEVKDREVLLKAKQLLGFYITGQSVAFRRLAELLVNSIEAQIDGYPTYKSSAEYQLKNKSRYENKKEDSTYFFG